jgi:hypothetical protein
MVACALSASGCRCPSGTSSLSSESMSVDSLLSDCC